MTTAQAQELLDSNSEMIRDIVKLQEEVERSGASPALADRKERLMARLQRRLLKLSRWSDTPYPERMRSDQEFEQKHQRALDQVLMNGANIKAQG